jgi:hypothetical protein
MVEEIHVGSALEVVEQGRRELDVEPLEGEALCLRMERLGVDDHAVEVEDASPETRTIAKAGHDRSTVCQLGGS